MFKDKRAREAIKLLGEKLNFKITFYNTIEPDVSDHRHFYSGADSKIIAEVRAIENLFSMLIDKLEYELFEGKEIREKKLKK